MAIKCRIKKGDKVKVITGNDKGKIGLVKAVYPKKNQLIVEGCKIAKKAVKPTDNNPKGGFTNKEMPMDISNVALVEE